MNFADVFKKSFLESGNYGDINTTTVIVSLGVTVVISLLIFVMYRLTTRKTFYSKNFNISLVTMAIMTAGIILTIQSSIVVSLGMVGALSIVRFRTAIKDPMDLFYLYWAIGTGIICGAQLYELAILIAVVVVVTILILEVLPVSSAGMILSIECNTNQCEEKIKEVLKKNVRHFSIKTRNATGEALNLLIEIKTKKEAELLAELTALPEVEQASLIMHNGELTV